MSATKTVVFADLTGSTGVFEAMGNALATEAITKLTQWIGSVCVAHRGRVVKNLGDGILAVFPEGASAISAVVELQRVHHQRLQEWPHHLWMRLQVGVSNGEIILRREECLVHGTGEIALRAPFDDFTVPTVSFRLVGEGA